MQNKTLKIAQELNNNASPQRRKFNLSRMDYVTSLIERYPEAETVVDEKHAVVAYKYTTAKEDPAIMVFIGKANKPAVHSAFFTKENRDARYDEIIKGLEAREERKAQRKLARSLPHTLVVGDILDSHWGYEQTNVNFYQVTKLVGSKMVELREIKARSVEEGQSLIKTPIANDFLNEEVFKKRVSGADGIKFSSFEYASKWNGKPQHATHPMFGH